MLPVGLLVAKKRNQLQHSILRFGARNPKGIPDVFTNEDKLEVILDQQQSSACAAFSFKQVLKIQHFQVKDPSASWIYSCVRDKEENYPKKKLEDNGVDPTDVLTVLTNIGIVKKPTTPLVWQRLIIFLQLICSQPRRRTKLVLPMRSILKIQQQFNS